MAMELLKDTLYLPKEIWEVKKIFKNFDKDEDSKKVLEEIIACGERNSVINRVLKVNKTYDMILRSEKNAKKYGWISACQEALKETGVNYEVRGAENIPKKEDIPENKGILYVSNHPYGLLDSMILVAGLGSVLKEEERKLKVIGMNQLKAIKGIEDIVCFVRSTKKDNIFAHREPINYLRKRGDLAIYPSGRMSKAGLKEYEWQSLISFLSFSSYVVPMWFSGPDHGMLYNLSSIFKEQARRVFSFRETFNKKGKKVILNIGEKIKINHEELRKKKNNGEIVQYLKREAEALKVAV